MSEHSGWIGSESELMNALRVVGADQTEDGKFKVAGSITSFMGLGEEFVVGADALFYKDDKPCGLATLLRSTSHGSKIQVF